MDQLSNRKDEIPRNLISPPASQTESSIALVWDKPEVKTEISYYQIYRNAELLSTSRSTDYTVIDLLPDQQYEFYIKTVFKNGNISAKSKTIKIDTKPDSICYDITSFGAKGDGKTLNTEAIQRAIDACCEGGKVYIPQGVFVSGAIFLKSNMTLYVEKGGELLGSSDTANYPLITYRWEGRETLCYASLINTNVDGDERLESVVIEGQGTINANGSALRKKEISEEKGKPGRAVCIRNTDYFYMKDITVRQSPAWCVHFIYCNHGSVNNVKVHTKTDENGKKYEGIANGDGLNPDSCSDMYIFHSMIASQDDCIAIKSGRDQEGRQVNIPSENIRVTNCRFESGFGVAVGSEMSGSVRNVLVQDCQFNDVYSVGSIKAPRGRGGIVENIRYEDITFKNQDTSLSDCKWFRGAIYIDQYYSHDSFDVNEEVPFTDDTSIIRNILFKNITLDTETGNAIYLTGLPESPLENVQLINVHAIGKFGCKANNINSLVLDAVSVESREDEKFMFNNVAVKKGTVTS